MEKVKIEPTKTEEIFSTEIEGTLKEGDQELINEALKEMKNKNIDLKTATLENLVDALEEIIKEMYSQEKKLPADQAKIGQLEDLRRRLQLKK